MICCYCVPPPNINASCALKYIAGTCSYVGVDAWAIHHDAETYPDPYKHDALRFSRPREEHKTLAAEGKSSVKGLEMKNLSMVTTGDDFFGFAHGRHACPERFFIAIELKLSLAHMLLEYDSEPLDKRPTNTWLGSMVLPPMRATMRVKKMTVPLI